MLIVKDLNRLKEYGFKKQSYRNNGHPVYVKDVHVLGLKEDILFSIIVNPFRMMNEPDTPNEAILNVYAEENMGFEHVFSLDLVMEMLHDGVMEWVPGKVRYRRVA